MNKLYMASLFSRLNVGSVTNNVLRKVCVSTSSTSLQVATFHKTKKCNFIRKEFSTSSTCCGTKQPRKFMPPRPKKPELKPGYKWPPGRKYPNDRRKEVSGKDVGPHKWGGSKEAARMYGRGLQPTGWRQSDGSWETVPEMIPEFVVPDLKNFKLKPYVAYNVPEVVQSELSPEDLFEACYAKQIAQDVAAGKVTGDIDEYINRTLVKDRKASGE